MFQLRIGLPFHLITYPFFVYIYRHSRATVHNQVARSIPHTAKLTFIQNHTEPADLSSCVAFQICGKADVFSLPHMDHHGVMTTITAEEGRKLWITWPKLQETELEE
jgi:hypothetical protein